MLGIVVPDSTGCWAVQSAVSWGCAPATRLSQSRGPGMGQGGGPEALPREDQMRELGTVILTRATEARVHLEAFENLPHRPLHAGPRGDGRSARAARRVSTGRQPPREAGPGCVDGAPGHRAQGQGGQQHLAPCPRPPHGACPTRLSSGPARARLPGCFSTRTETPAGGEVPGGHLPTFRTDKKHYKQTLHQKKAPHTSLLPNTSL